jgi:hypothetical protein
MCWVRLIEMYGDQENYGALPRSMRKQAKAKVRKVKSVSMTSEKSCPLSKEKKDSASIRVCTVDKRDCVVPWWTLNYKQCHVFLKSNSKLKGGEKYDRES